MQKTDFLMSCHGSVFIKVFSVFSVHVILKKNLLFLCSCCISTLIILIVCPFVLSNKTLLSFVSKINALTMDKNVHNAHVRCDLFILM